MKKINKKQIYGLSPEIIARQIEDTLVIVPLISGIGKLDEDIFSLNDTGKVIWQMLDGKRSVQNIIMEIARRYNKDIIIIEKDVIEFLQILIDKEFLIEIRDPV